MSSAVEKIYRRLMEHYWQAFNQAQAWRSYFEAAEVPIMENIEPVKEMLRKRAISLAESAKEELIAERALNDLSSF